MNILEFSALIWLGSLASGFLGALTGLGGGEIFVPFLTSVKVTREVRSRASACIRRPSPVCPSCRYASASSVRSGQAQNVG
jgi:uncharacterized membrane protein YfcA